MAERVAERTSLVSQYAVLGLSWLYVLIGVLGFFGSGGAAFVGEGGLLFGVLGVNILHNLLHIAVGVLGLALWDAPGGAPAFGRILAVGFGALLAYGLVEASSERLSLLSINHADNVLHLASAAAGVALILWAPPTASSDG